MRIAWTLTGLRRDEVCTPHIRTVAWWVSPVRRGDAKSKIRNPKSPTRSRIGRPHSGGRDVCLRAPAHTLPRRARTHQRPPVPRSARSCAPPSLRLPAHPRARTPRSRTPTAGGSRQGRHHAWGSPGSHAHRREQSSKQIEGTLRVVDKQILAKSGVLCRPPVASAEGSAQDSSIFGKPVFRFITRGCEVK